MSIENIPQVHENQPTELAPFRSIEGLSSRGQFKLVNTLSEYLEDTTTARAMEIQRYGIYDNGIPAGSWNPEYETYLDNATRDALDRVASDGKTFLVQELAKGLVESPVARAFDKRPGHQLGLPREKWQFKPGYDEKGMLKAPDKDMYERFFASIPSREQIGERVFAEAERDFVDKGYLEEGALESDGRFLAYREQGNFVAMQGRIWHMAYEMPKDSQEKTVLPYSFEMTAYGSISPDEVSREFYGRFTRQEPIEYKEIIQAGLQYVPVQTSPDSIGFFEESGRCVGLFRAPENLQPGDKAESLNVEGRVAELLANASEEEIMETAQAHYLLMGNLQMRNILERSLDVRLSEFTVDEQIFLSKLLIKATPEQMEAVVKHGPETIKNVARALEFGDDYSDTILSILESSAVSEELKSETLQAIIRMRENVEVFTNKIAMVAGEAFAHNVHSRFANRVTDILYGVKYYADNGDKTQNLQMGSAKVDVSVPEETLKSALRKIDEALSGLAAIKISETPTSTGDEMSAVEFGYVAGTEDSVLLMTKPYRGKSRDGMVRGSKPRMNFMFGVDGQSPSLNMLERDGQAISVRLDLDEDGILRLDVGGKPLGYREDDTSTHDIDTPDFVVAKLISLGNWYRSQHIGGESSDYHVDLQPMSPKEFADAVRAIRGGIEYSQTPLNIVREQGKLAIASVAADLDKAA